jgi:hypothetical protein
MAPDTWSQAELVRAIAELKSILSEMRAEQKAQRHEMVPREVWDEWKQNLATDLVNLEAEQARIRKEVREEFASFRSEQRNTVRWSLGFAVSAFGVAIAGTAFLMNALGLGA